eukprot:TRINITY_DN4455_c0_g2_i1.p1 TRINITY_DN4455_c0_g2~~TRINITY_DN4455_c0_g2_i1.p1  ORF type:complete len:479 (+),score=148.11 TRINITY_DN4455_c0_g2_i1:69-1505(+)
MTDAPPRPPAATALLTACAAPIIEYLTPEDVVQAAAVSKRWRHSMTNPVVWQGRCRADWGMEDGEMEGGAYAAYCGMARRYLRFRECYGPIRRLWRRYENWMRAHSPHMLASLNPGATVEELDRAMGAAGVQLPLEVQCFYAIHDGQKLPTRGAERVPLHFLDGSQEDEWAGHTGTDHHPACLGMFGGWSAYNAHASLFFLKFDHMVRMKREDEARGIDYFPVGFDVTSAEDPTMSQCLLLQSAAYTSERSTRPAWSVCYNGASGGCPYAASRGTQNTNYFLAGGSLLGHVNTLVTRLETGVYRARLGEVQLFPCGNALGATTTTTNGVTIEASPLLIPHASSPHRHVYVYRVTLKGSIDAQMNFRTWTTRKRREDPFDTVVHARAVVGYHPIVGPEVKPWEYASMTAVEGEAHWEEMGGALSFVPGSLKSPTGDEFNAPISPMTLAYVEQDVLDATHWPPQKPVGSPARQHADPAAL